MLNLLSKLSTPSHFSSMLKNGAIMTKCGWCGNDTPVYQPMDITGDSGTTCQWCHRTVDEYYRDWTHREEDADGCYKIDFLSCGQCRTGRHACGHDNEFIKVKEWTRSMEEASLFTVPEPDYANILSGFPVEFQEFFREILDGIGCTNYFSGGSRELIDRWHYDVMPQNVYDLWKDGKYYHAIAYMHRDLPDKDEDHFRPCNPFLRGRESVVIHEILQIIYEKEKSKEGKNDYVESVLFHLREQIGKLLDLESQFIPSGEPDNDRMPSSKLMHIIHKYQSGYPVEDYTEDYLQLTQSDLDEMMDLCWDTRDNIEFYFDVLVQWPYAEHIMNYSITNGFFGKMFRTYQYDEKTILIDMPFQNVGTQEDNTKVWLIGQSLNP